MKIAILSNFQESKRSYALYNVAAAEADCLARQGHQVKFFVEEGYRQTEPLPPRFSAEIVPAVPKPEEKLRDYRKRELLSKSHRGYAEYLSKWLLEELPNYDVVISHDWIFTGWNLPYFIALELIREETRGIKFLHWIHSIPGMLHDWWYLRLLGDQNHRICYPNNVDRLRVSNFYRTDLDKVLHIPEIVDLRDLWHMQERTLDFIDDHPELLSSHIVQVYPASSDRLDAKGVRELILLFSEFKRRGFAVCLVIANQSAQKDESIRKVQHMIRLGQRNDLFPGVELVFTSEESRGDYTAGVPKDMLTELMAFSNVFIFPSQHETFGLVLPETILASGALPVLNRSLGVQLEVSGATGLLADFGSYYTEWKPKNEKDWIIGLAGKIVAQIQAEESVKLRTRFRRYFNKDIIYNRFYVPILEGSGLWG